MAEQLHFEKKKQYTIAFGLVNSNRSSTTSIPQAIHLIVEKFKEDQMPFSLRIGEGGYTYRDTNSYGKETTFGITLIGAEEDYVKALAKTLKQSFDQESIMLTAFDTEIAYL